MKPARLLSLLFGTLCWQILPAWADANLVDSDLSHLSLQASQQLFDQYNYEVAIAKRNVRGAEADTLSAAQRPNPNITLGTSHVGVGNGVNRNPINQKNGIFDRTYDSVVQFNQLIERGDKRQLRMDAANDALAASRYDLSDMQRQQKLALNNAYYNLKLAQENEQIQRTNNALYNKTLEAAQLREKAGDIAAADVARIRVDALRSTNDLRLAAGTRQKSQQDLAYIIGKQNDALQLQATDAWPNLSSVEQVVNHPLDNPQIEQRPDMLAADMRKKQAESNRKLAEALKTRDVLVGVLYEHYPGQGNGNPTNTLGANITIPLFTNYQYQGEIARAEANADLAEQLKEQTRAQAVTEVGKAKADLLAAAERIKRYDTQMLQEAQKASEAAEFAYSHGAMNVNDLLDSRRVLRAIQLDAATARADFAKSLAAWKAALYNESSTIGAQPSNQTIAPISPEEHP